MIHVRAIRSPVIVSSFAVLAVGVACFDFAHRNPFDPATPLEVAIVPETLFSVGGEIHFVFSTVPEIIDPTASWSGGNAELNPQGGGIFVSRAAPLWPQTETIPVSISVGRNDVLHLVSYQYSRVFGGSIVITQRLVRIQARCPDTHLCDTLSVGATASVFVDGSDALGSAISGLSSPAANPLGVTPIAQFIVRDSSIASASAIGMRVAVATARKSGSTWLVAQRDSLRDSVRIVVR